MHIAFLRRNCWGNASSSHAYGARAKAALNTARSQVAELIEARADQIIFTSGGTEASNWVIWGSVQLAHQQQSAEAPQALPHIVASAVEHCATLQCIAALEARGMCSSTLVPVGADGCVEVPALLAAVTPCTVLVTLMHSNNETGALQPVQAVAEALTALQHPLLKLHVDASQSLGKVPVGVGGVDFMTVAGHKLYAPQGTGALFSRDPKGATALPAYFQGGHQEGGCRPGTESIPGAAALGAAAAAALAYLRGGGRDTMQALTERLTQGILTHHAAELAACVARGRLSAEAAAAAIPVQHGPALRSCLPNTLSIGFPGALAGDIQAALQGSLSISAGAACHSDVAGASVSHVLAAMDVPRSVALGTVRVSLGKYSTHAEVDTAGQALAKAAARAMEMRTETAVPSAACPTAMSAVAVEVPAPPAWASGGGSEAPVPSLESARLYMQDTMLMHASSTVVAVGASSEAGLVFQPHGLLQSATLRRRCAPDTRTQRAPHPQDGVTVQQAMKDKGRAITTAAPSTLKDVPSGKHTGVVLLDACVFHPQGGGQPADAGWIVSSSGAVFRVLTARSVDVPLSPCSSTVALYGVWCAPLGAGETPPDLARADSDADAAAFVTERSSSGSGAEPVGFSPGDSVQCWVHASARLSAARLHSAGHLLDMAMRNLEQDLKPGRGYHFADGPWVEYEGAVPAEERSALVAALNAEMARLIELDADTVVQAVPATSSDQLQQMGVSCADVAAAGYSSEDSVRVVCVGDGSNGCMCGGTHVPAAGMLGGVTVTKLKVKKGATKISYVVQGVGKEPK